MQPLVVGVAGDDKSGKTSFALSAPRPIFHMGLDVGGFYRAEHRFRNDIAAGVVSNREYPFPQQALMGDLFSRFRQSYRLLGMKELWFDAFLTDYYSALTGETPPDTVGKTKPFLAPCGQPYQTIIMDNAALVWNLCCMAFLQEKQEAQEPLRQGERYREKLAEIEYAEPNARYRALVNTARAVGKNLILLHPLTDERKERINGKGEIEKYITGKHIPEGWRRSGQVVDMMIETTRTVLADQNIVKAKVVLSGMSLDLHGVELPSPDWMSMVNLISIARGE